MSDEFNDSMILARIDPEPPRRTGVCAVPGCKICSDDEKGEAYTPPLPSSGTCEEVAGRVGNEEA